MVKVESKATQSPAEAYYARLASDTQPKGTVEVPLDLIRRAQQAINWHLEPNSPDEYERTMLELSAIGWPEEHALVEAVLATDSAPVQQTQAPAPAPDAFPSAIFDLLLEVADRKGKPGFGPWEDGNGGPMQDDADAAIAWIKARSSQAPAVGA